MSSLIKYDYCNYSTLCDDPVRQAFATNWKSLARTTARGSFLCEKLNFAYYRVVRRSRSAVLTFVKEFSKVFFAPLNTLQTLGLKKREFERTFHGTVRGTEVMLPNLTKFIPQSGRVVQKLIRGIRCNK